MDSRIGLQSSSPECCGNTRGRVAAKSLIETALNSVQVAVWPPIGHALDLVEVAGVVGWKLVMLERIVVGL